MSSKGFKQPFGNNIGGNAAARSLLNAKCTHTPCFQSESPTIICNCADSQIGSGGANFTIRAKCYYRKQQTTAQIATKAADLMDTQITKPAEPSTTDLGRRVRAARQSQDLTLETASRLCGVSRSTLSKVENGLMSPTFDVLQKIVLGLKIEIGELFGSMPKVSASGRRALTRKGEGQRHAYRGYQMELLATDLAHKAMLPFRIRISAHTLDAFDDWGRHEGEEFLYVISGSVCLHSELYAPTHLNAGDSLYFDSRTGHAAVSTSEEDAEVLWMATSADIPQAPAVNESPKKQREI